MSKETYEKLLPLKNELEKLCHTNCDLCPFAKEMANHRYVCSILQHFQTLLDGINFLNRIAPNVIREIYRQSKGEDL